MRMFSILALLLCSLSALPSARADASPTQLNIIALGQGRVLEATPPRQLSLNAHVQNFAYQPGGLEIAYASSDTDGGATTQFVRLVGTRHGTIVTLLTQAGPSAASDAAGQAFIVDGWSADGRYLVVEQYGTVGTNGAGAPVPGARLTCIDVGASPPQVRPIVFPAPLPPGTLSTSTLARWSPSHTRLLLTQSVEFRGGPAAAETLDTDTTALYDFGQNRVSVLPVAAPMHAGGWLDDTHLRLSGVPDPRAHPLMFSIITGKTEPRASFPPPSFASLSVSPTNPALTLDVQRQPIVNTERTAQTPARALWVRRTHGPKALSTLAVDVTGGSDDPQAQWAQTGREVAYLSHGDLFVADLSTRDATVKEKYFAGERLTCLEEQQLAMGEVKQIGLAAIQYAQDYDEHYPPQENVGDTLQPYLPPDTLLQVGGAKFVYHAPADLALSKMDSPADTVLGTMDLPCARVTLYADGHVKSVPLADKQP